jgi:FkbM family methyltransferase
MSELIKKAEQSLAMLRYFRTPFLPILARLGIFHLDYCSYDIRKNGHSYRLIARPLGGDQAILREMFLNESYAAILPVLPDRPLRVLDIGAHIGSFTLWLTQQRAVAEAYCFEPDPDSFNLCRFNLAQQPNVQVIMSAIGGRTRRSAISIDPAAHSRSTIVEDMGRASNTRSIDITILSFAEWLADHPGSFDLLKMDCEGAEWEILRTCPEVFSRFSTIIAEIHYDPVERRTNADFARSMQQLGFRVIPLEHLFLGTKVA